MSKPLEGKVAVITGSGRRAGLGEAIARRLASDGLGVTGFDAHTLGGGPKARRRLSNTRHELRRPE